MGKRGKGHVSEDFAHRHCHSRHQHTLTRAQRAGGAGRETSKPWADFDMTTITNKAFVDYYKVSNLRQTSCSL